ncbi:S8 family peptidase [Nocardioides sp. HM23]|uniref:S8 family peptidase n=1 Tax=Nocardioides bizhenqiangii TaxID=3095076 RepID=UPI002ACA510E|nr:S8 family peptidase [Nocardioides sp. HM23]MDZ5622902.1 S8 family peptidase [Nocardioides sp. HM23]
MRARTGALRLVAALLVAGGLSAVTHDSAAGVPERQRDDDRATSTDERAGRVIQGQYIVVMKKRVGTAATRDARGDVVRGGGDILFDYGDVLDGFAARLPERALQALENNPNVAYVEADRTVVALGDQYDPPWGLDRIDQRARGLSRSYHYDTTGAGVKAYIVDSGIRRTHAQFGTRASHGFTAINDGRGSRDCNGHGTHVAGTVGSNAYGVAKKVNLVAVRVLDCEGNGSNAGVIAGIDWVTGDHQAGQPAVANMSLGGPFSNAVNTAVANSIADGVSFVVAAGNDNIDACTVSPASAPAALTVGATTYTDARASYSNWGTCLDLFAPGSQVLSTYATSDSGLHIENGTSMASPHVAGVVATYLQANPAASPATVANAVLNSATPDKVTNVGVGSPNRLLYSKFDSTNTSPPPPGSTNRVKQPGFESGPGVWQGTEWSINCDDGDPVARNGKCHVWLRGYGTAGTDQLSQRGIVLPAAAKTLRFHTWIASAETGSTAFDKLFVRVVANGTTTTVKTFSNLNESTGYVQRSIPLGAFKGKTIELRFVGVEDSSRATSFLIDNVSIS